MVSHLEKKHQFFAAVFADLENYCDLVREELKKPVEREELADESNAHKEVIVDNFVHAD